MRKINLLILLLLTLTTQLLAVDINRKYGKVSKEELLMNIYEKDSSAGAVILFDIGHTYFNYNANKGFQMVYERHIRIKLFNKDAFDYGDFSISLYKDGSDEERISKLKAVTYNLEGNKIVEDKLKNRDVYTIEDTPNKTIRKFSLPSIKEGSVIEVNYIIMSDFYYNLQKWNFQHFIPTIWSEYTVEIPEYFIYNKITKGYLPFDLQETEIKNDFITTTSKSRAGGQGMTTVSTNYSTEKIDFNKKVIKLGIQDAPAMKKEAFMLAANNYMSSIEFELAQIKFPYSELHNYSTSWEAINKKLLDHQDFGDQLKNGKFLSDLITQIKNGTTSPEEQINKIYSYLISNYKWDETNSLYTSQNLRQTFKEKKGNSADLNLLLVLLLKEAGFDAYPVIISTRNHGLLNLVNPSLSQMNYVIALLQYNGQEILMDATDPYCVPGMLPPRCVNDKGRVISKNNSRWVNIEPTEKYQTVSFGNFDITTEGIKGSLSCKETGFASYNFRHKYKSFTNEEDLIANIESKNPNVKINEYHFENIDSLNKPVQIKYTDFETESFENLGDILYLNPVIVDKINENPFKLEKRSYPIDYNYLYNEKYIFNYKIPDGYTIEEMPANVQIGLPDNNALYQYLIRSFGNTLQVTITFSINKRQFLPDDYQSLKDFYNKIIAKEKEQIVLKKS